MEAKTRIPPQIKAFGAIIGTLPGVLVYSGCRACRKKGKHRVSAAMIALLLVAALLHAAWNFLLKKSTDRYIVTWWALLAGSLLFLPFLMFGQPLPATTWAFVLLSALFEAAYFTTLNVAYSKGDFSLVYPLARGAAPALLLIWSMLFLKERPRPIGIAGLILIVLGLILVGSTSMRIRAPRLAASSGAGFALLTA